VNIPRTFRQLSEEASNCDHNEPLGFLALTALAVNIAVVSDEPVNSTFMVKVKYYEDGGSRFLRNFDNYQRDYMRKIREDT
jgi:hypothetical protein